VFCVSDQDLSRSPLLLSTKTSSLLVVDLQEKLLPLIPHQQRLLANAELLVKAANLFQLPVSCTQQYPKGLGPTVSSLAELLPEPAESKLMFSCRECSGIFERLHQQGRNQILIVGIEAHVCVQQTALDLLAMGFECYLAVDAIGSRHAVDRDTALSRMEIAGVTLTTTESVLFEWCRDCKDPNFKQISTWIKQRDAN